jgi:hypothetical protein
MTSTEELRLLAVVLKRIEQPPRFKSTLWLRVCVWLLLVVSFIALFGFASRIGPIIYVVAGISGLLGIIASFTVIYARSLAQWPVLAQYIKAEEIKLRIAELKPNTSLERTRGK